VSDVTGWFCCVGMWGKSLTVGHPPWLLQGGQVFLFNTPPVVF
jgi:hypothetical protein